MSRNANSRFALAPSVRIPRTRMKRPFNNSLTFDCGELVPFYFSEVLPGSTHKVKTHKVVRTQPLVSAPFQDLFLDSYYFFVPFRLVWSHWKNFMGENTSSPWVPDVEYKIPQLFVKPEGATGRHILKGTLPDYFGMPLNNVDPNGEISMSALYMRAYALIVREFFQSETVETPLNVPLDDNDRAMVNSGSTDAVINDEQNIHIGAKPYIVNKFHDYFTSLLPSPLKAQSDVLALPDMPVIPMPTTKSFDEIKAMQGKSYPVPTLYGVDGSSPSAWNGRVTLGLGGDTGSGNTKWTISNLDTGALSDEELLKQMRGYVPLNLTAFNSTSIEDLRLAFAIQRLLERDAVGGTRYREVLLAHFGVTSPDASMQVPQYLGGNRKMLNISQVLNVADNSETPLGRVGGYSLTNDSNFDFEQSFTEHGLILGLMCVRYKHRYSQGIRRCLSRKTRFDFYFPEMASLGSQATLKKEIYADGSSADDDVLGYSEYWSEYRFNPDMVCSEFRPDIDTGLKSWTFADVYNTHPTLSREWLKEDKSNLDRCLAVTSSRANQLFANVEVDETVTLPMPLYSYPSIMAQF